MKVQNNKIMKKRKIKIMLRHENAHLPKYATERSAGADVCTVEEIILAPGERTMVHTGIYMELPEDIEVYDILLEKLSKPLLKFYFKKIINSI